MPAKGNFKIRGGMVGGSGRGKPRIKEDGVVDETGVEVMTPAEELKNIRRIIPMPEPIPVDQRPLTFNTSELPSFIDRIADEKDITLEADDRIQIIQTINQNSPAVNGRYTMSRQELKNSVDDANEAHILTDSINEQRITEKPIKRYQTLLTKEIKIIKDNIINEISEKEDIDLTAEEKESINRNIRVHSLGRTIAIDVYKLITIIRNVIRHKQIMERNKKISAIKPNPLPKAMLEPTARTSSPSRSVSPVLQVNPKKRGLVNIIEDNEPVANPIQTQTTDYGFEYSGNNNSDSTKTTNESDTITVKPKHRTKKFTLDDELEIEEEEKEIAKQKRELTVEKFEMRDDFRSLMYDINKGIILSLPLSDDKLIKIRDNVLIYVDTYDIKKMEPSTYDILVKMARGKRNLADMVGLDVFELLLKYLNIKVEKANEKKAIQVALNTFKVEKKTLKGDKREQDKYYAAQQIAIENNINYIINHIIKNKSIDKDVKKLIRDLVNLKYEDISTLIKYNEGNDLSLLNTPSYMEKTFYDTERFKEETEQEDKTNSFLAGKDFEYFLTLNPFTIRNIMISYYPEKIKDIMGMTDKDILKSIQNIDDVLGRNFSPFDLLIKNDTYKIYITLEIKKYNERAYLKPQSGIYNTYASSLEGAEFDFNIMLNNVIYKQLIKLYDDGELIDDFNDLIDFIDTFFDDDGLKIDKLLDKYIKEYDYVGYVIKFSKFNLDLPQKGNKINPQRNIDYLKSVQRNIKEIIHINDETGLIEGIDLTSKKDTLSNKRKQDFLNDLFVDEDGNDIGYKSGVIIGQDDCILSINITKLYEEGVIVGTMAETFRLGESAYSGGDDSYVIPTYLVEIIKSKKSNLKK